MPEVIRSTYEVLQRIGVGGGGVVFLANHKGLNKEVVLKVDKRTVTTSSDLLRREVDVLKELRHPYIPQVYDFFIENETVYTAMEYINGESLDKALKRGEKFSQPQVITWAVQLLEALEYLHSPTHGTPPHGYVHSDIKPANIMRRDDGNICLIDFNISLALGEDNVVGASAGYASPEHYGVDFSFSSITATQTNETVLMEGVSSATATLTMHIGQPSPIRKKVVPDVRSDIYSTGATLYHLLTGRRPDKDATKVMPLTSAEASEQIAKIIAKAMNPNPDLRYQSAAEMLWDLKHLHPNDPRSQALKRQIRVTAVVLILLLFTGGICTFTGLYQMQKAETLAKKAEEAARAALTALGKSENALRSGDAPGAVAFALDALTLDTPYTSQAQQALTVALGVYDLSDGFKSHLLLTLPSEPLKVVLSPEGTRTAAVTSGQVTVFDTESGTQLAALPADPSALTDVLFAGEDMLLYAGNDALRAYSLTDGKELWTGNAVTGIALSADGSTVAAVYKDENIAATYETATGTVLRAVTFQEQTQWVVANDVFADPGNSLFALNSDGTLLAVSFSSGALRIFDLRDSANDLIIYEESEFIHFEGGFFGQYLAFSATGGGRSVFAIIDVPGAAQTGGFASTMPFHVQADESGIYVSTEDVLVQLDPVTGAQTEMAYTNADITSFIKSGSYAVTATADDAFSIFGPGAQHLETWEDSRCDFVQLAGSFAVVASIDAPTLRILKLENHSEAQVFSYDPAYAHSETRLSWNGNTVMLFRYDRFRLYGIGGEILAETEIPDAGQVYDQQYRRSGEDSWLEITYNSGLIRNYSAVDGRLISEADGEVPDGTLYQEYLTDRLRIEAPLHGTPIAYDRETGELVAELETDDYLTYVTQVGEYVVTEYITGQGERYGLLLNEACETLAYLPNLCDILEDSTLVFDDMAGNLRRSRIYSIQELIVLAQN